MTLLIVTQFVSLSKLTQLKFSENCSESVGFDTKHDVQEDLKFFKSDTFENYKSFVPVEVRAYDTYCNSNAITVDCNTNRIEQIHI